MKEDLESLIFKPQLTPINLNNSGIVLIIVIYLITIFSTSPLEEPLCVPSVTPTVFKSYAELVKNMKFGYVELVDTTLGDKEIRCCMYVVCSSRKNDHSGRIYLNRQWRRPSDRDLIGRRVVSITSADCKLIYIIQFI